MHGMLGFFSVLSLHHIVMTGLLRVVACCEWTADTGVTLMGTLLLGHHLLFVLQDMSRMHVDMWRALAS